VNKHLARAKDYIGKGEAFYRKAAEEIVAAMAEDTTLSYREIDRSLGYSGTGNWSRDLVRWSTSAPGPGAPATPWANTEPNEAREERAAKRVLRDSSPEQIAEQFLSDPAVRAKVSHAQDIAHSNLQKRSREAERQAIGEEASDDLAGQQTLRDAEAELFKARRALIETLRLLNQAGATLTDSWREEFLRTFDDIAVKVDLGRGLLVGALDDELDNLLAEESR